MATMTIKTNGDRKEYKPLGEYSKMVFWHGRAKWFFTDKGRKIFFPFNTIINEYEIERKKYPKPNLSFAY